MSNVQQHLHQQNQQQQNVRREIYRYESPWTLYAMNWSQRPDKKFRLAVASFMEEYNNKIQVVQLDEEANRFVLRTQFDHPYPATKIAWFPDNTSQYPDLLATSADYLRLFRFADNDTCMSECMLNSNRTSDFCSPLTSFDWNEVDVSLIGTSSIDTTCTIWKIETGQIIGQVIGGEGQSKVTGKVEAQLIAHDKEVYDIAFSKGTGESNVFASVGADGSVRVFDLRSLDHSTIIYEDPARIPLLRLAWNKLNPNFLATMAMDSNEIIILDQRMMTQCAARLRNHQGCVNAIDWAPNSYCHICTAADDRQALIWDLREMPKPIEDPALAYTAEGEINQVHWSTAQPDWIAICFGNNMEILRV